MFREIVATRTVEPGAGATFRNTNKLFGRDRVIGLKTVVHPAGGNLVWASTQDIAGTPG
ncbi:D-alanyl-D-alanine carboxypeptidase OS=Streptomyces microflavus OX=1919 GN=dacC PE=3 SV=1 [Streptomyces microflavus]